MASKKREVKLFGKEIPVRDYDCRNVMDNQRNRFKKDRVNLFIQVTGRCNARCKFCEWHTGSSCFDIEKLGRILKEITSRDDIMIRKLNFTGGEPTLDIIKFNEVVGCTRDYIKLDEKPEITLNTNGIHLLDLVPYERYIDSIGLSRHHYDDKINTDIFQSDKVADIETISEFQNRVKNKGLVQLRCNVITGYIETFEDVKRYLNHAIAAGVYDCGFVTLMPINDYCKEHQVDFYKLLDTNDENIIKVNGFVREEDGCQVCECGNYVYSDYQGHFCKFYNRYFSCCDLTEGQLVYDGQYLRYGFGGDIIY